jgi:hypothetical protein
VDVDGVLHLMGFLDLCEKFHCPKIHVAGPYVFAARARLTANADRLAPRHALVPTAPHSLYLPLLRAGVF